MTNPSPTASSATAGFFQALPSIPIQYTLESSRNKASKSIPNDDPVIQRILALYLPQPVPQEVDVALYRTAQVCLSPSTLHYFTDAEINVPTLHSLNTFGQPNESNALRTSEGWRKLKDIGIRLGSVALGYSLPDGHRDVSWNRRIHQFATNHFWSGSAALVTCPAAMSDGAALILGHALDDPDGSQPGRNAVLKQARSRLVSFDPKYAWTSGQWMTERSGGSSVNDTETSASLLSTAQLEADSQEFGSDTDNVGMPLGPWKIDGFKWFSSATDADMVILLARTSKGISTFYAPMRRMRASVAIMNGVRITRLKNKLGTRALPTAELEISGMRAWLIGEEGKGVRSIGTILNITRLWTAAGALGGWARGLAISRAFSRVRKIKDVLLMDNEQHVRWMAGETVKYRAAMHFAYLGVALCGIVEQGSYIAKHTKAAVFLPTDVREAGLLLRILTPVMKAQCSLAGVDGLRACMESLGGVGYCENNEDGGIMNIARLFRDGNVNPIWEGTVSVMAEDLVRVVKGRESEQTLSAVDHLICRIFAKCKPTHDEICDQITTYWQHVRTRILHSSVADLLYDGRALLRAIENLVCASLLLFDASTDGNDVAVAVAFRWMSERQIRKANVEPLLVQREFGLDQSIFLGNVVSSKAAHAHL